MYPAPDTQVTWGASHHRNWLKWFFLPEPKPPFLPSSVVSSPLLLAVCHQKVWKDYWLQVTDMKQLRNERDTVDENSEPELLQYLFSILSFEWSIKNRNPLVPRLWFLVVCGSSRTCTFVDLYFCRHALVPPVLFLPSGSQNPAAFSSLLCVLGPSRVNSPSG